MSGSLPSEIYDLLKNSLDQDIENFSISIHDPNQKGEGYLGDFCFVSLKDKNNGKVLDLAVKQAFTDEERRKVHPIRRYYLNEIYFYTKAWPCLQRIQEEFHIKHPFDKIPKCIVTSSEVGKEKLVLENLKCQNFKVHTKNIPFNLQQAEYIFRQYGKFHGISFAYKILKPQEYEGVFKELQNLFIDLCHVNSFQVFIKYVHELCLKTLDEEKDSKTIEKYRPYIENGVDIFEDASVYKGNYSVILHGDCWSNNMMFKYSDTNEFIDMRMLDFQLAKTGTPVSDLSYSLYSAASTEVLDHLDNLLKTYHTELLKIVEQFGCDSKTVYPFDVLKKDWKIYCKFGFTMGLPAWWAKFTLPNDVLDATDTIDPELKKVKNSGYDEERFGNAVRGLLRHMSENDFL